MLCAPQPALLKAFSYCGSEAFWQLAFCEVRACRSARAELAQAVTKFSRKHVTLS